MDSSNEDDMVIEGMSIPVKNPKITWYFKHNTKEVVDVDADDIDNINKATAEQTAFLQSIRKEEADQTAKDAANWKVPVEQNDRQWNY